MRPLNIPIQLRSNLNLARLLRDWDLLGRPGLDGPGAMIYRGQKFRGMTGMDISFHFVAESGTSESFCRNRSDLVPRPRFSVVTELGRKKPTIRNPIRHILQIVYIAACSAVRIEQTSLASRIDVDNIQPSLARDLAGRGNCPHGQRQVRYERRSDHLCGRPREHSPFHEKRAARRIFNPCYDCPNGRGSKQRNQGIIGSK